MGFIFIFQIFLDFFLRCDKIKIDTRLDTSQNIKSILDIKIMKINEIKGGFSNEKHAVVFCDKTDVIEMDKIVVDVAFASSFDFGMLTISDIRSSEEEDMLRGMFPNISKDAVQAILNANLRCVKVDIFFHQNSRVELFKKLIDFRDKVDMVRHENSRIMQRLNKILRKLGEKEIDIDSLFELS